uniref:Uncharacterized protein n=1 Tax=Candidatus Methanomethylicus mesodigestus TaxID=1867258 RepID=A0A7C3EZG2_9CREN
MVPGRGKRERRIAYLESVAGYWVCIVFRGGWIDGISMARVKGAHEVLEGWLEGLKYFVELAGVALGAAVAGELGPAGVEGLARWLRASGKALQDLGAANRRAASAITEGIRRYIDGEGRAERRAP